jgi:sec-independent protein translocase protein TatC
VFLFVIGAVFAYVTLPSALDFLVSLGGDNLIPFFSANEYLSFIGLIILVFGVVFEAPLMLFFLGLVGVVNVSQLRGFRRMAIVGITIVAAVVTPSQDPYTMLAMAVPLYLFYEGTILALALVDKRRAKRAGRR